MTASTAVATHPSCAAHCSVHNSKPVKDVPIGGDHHEKLPVFKAEAHVSRKTFPPEATYAPSWQCITAGWTEQVREAVVVVDVVALVEVVICKD